MAPHAGPWPTETGIRLTGCAPDGAHVSVPPDFVIGSLPAKPSRDYRSVVMSMTNRYLTSLRSMRS